MPTICRFKDNNCIFTIIKYYISLGNVSPRSFLKENHVFSVTMFEKQTEIKEINNIIQRIICVGKLLNTHVEKNCVDDVKTFDKLKSFSCTAVLSKEWFCISFYLVPLVSMCYSKIVFRVLFLFENANSTWFKRRKYILILKSQHSNWRRFSYHHYGTWNFTSCYKLDIVWIQK